MEAAPARASRWRVSESSAAALFARSEARIYPALLGAAWSSLHVKLQTFFGVFGVWHGRFDIRRGGGPWAWLAMAVIGLPRAATNVPMTLEVTPTRRGERWHRRFGRVNLVTLQWAERDGLLIERMFGIEITLQALVVGHEVRLEQVAAHLALGPLRVPIPRLLSPRVTARTSLRRADDMVHVHVSVVGTGTVPWMEYEGVVAYDSAP
jgi:Domain of unknown function (DUF4166)